MGVGELAGGGESMGQKWTGQGRKGRGCKRRRWWEVEEGEREEKGRGSLSGANLEISEWGSSKLRVKVDC